MLILCLKIFFVRIIDVSMGTFRTIVTVKGQAKTAACIGFFEVLIWFLIVREALNTDIDSLWIAISYSLGYATGTYIGSILSNIFINGNLRVQVILSSKNNELIDKLRQNNFGVTITDVRGIDDQEKYMLYCEIKNKRLNELKKLIKANDEKAFITVNETKLVQNGYIK